MTAAIPDELFFSLFGPSTGPHNWEYIESSLYHNGKKLVSGLPDLCGLDINQKVGLLLSPDGDLHVYLDGRHITKAASGLPVNQPLWGLVNVYSNCSKIKSELLSGEWDNGIVVDLCPLPFTLVVIHTCKPSVCVVSVLLYEPIICSVYSHNSVYT